MLTHLSIKNFQSVEDLNLSFGRFTVLVGPTDSGKSAIIRAINAMLTNPRGQGFVSHWSDHVEIVGDFAAGVLTWSKGQADHFYRFQDQSYRKIGTSVPGIILETLKLAPYEASGISVDLHVQHQFETPFLIGDTGPNRAKLLSGISGLDLLMASSKLSADTRRGLLGKVKEAKTQLTSLDREILGLNWVPEVEESIRRLKILPLDSLDQRLQACQVLCAKAVKAKTLLDSVDVPGLQLILGSVIALDLGPRQEAISKGLQLIQRIKSYSEKVQSTQSIPVLSDSLAVDSTYNRLIQASELYNRIATNFNQFRRIDQELKTNRQQMIAMAKALPVLEQQLKICPVCGRSFGADHETSCS